MDSPVTGKAGFPARFLRGILFTTVVAVASAPLLRAQATVQGEPAVGNAAGTNWTTSDMYLDASRFGGADMCAKISAACQSANSNGVIDARQFTGAQACNSNMFASCNKTVNLLLNPNVLIVASVPQFTPSLPHRIDGGVAGNVLGTSGATITACGPQSPSGAGWNNTTLTCLSGTVPQFPNATNRVTFAYQHGKFPGSTYACLVCGGGEGTSEGQGWNNNAGGEEIDGLAFDLGGNANTFGYYTMNETERSVLSNYRFGGYDPASAYEAGIFYDRTEAPNGQPGPARNSLQHGNMAGTLSANNAEADGIDYEGSDIVVTVSPTGCTGPVHAWVSSVNTSGGVAQVTVDPNNNGTSGCTAATCQIIGAPTVYPATFPNNYVVGTNNNGATCTATVAGGVVTTIVAGTGGAATNTGYNQSWITGGPMIDDVNCASGASGKIADCIFVEGVGRAEVKNVHTLDTLGYGVNYGAMQKTAGGEISLVDANVTTAGNLQLGAGIDNTQRVSALSASGTSLTIVNDIKNGLTLTTSNYTDGLGMYLPANFIVGGNAYISQPTIVFSTASFSTNGSIPATTMLTNAGATHWYRLSWYVDQTGVGVGCTAGTTLLFNLIFTDPSASGTNTLALSGFGPNTSNSATLNITSNGTPNGSLGQVVASGQYTFAAAASTAVQYSTTYTLGTGCNPTTGRPSYSVFPLLELVN